MPSKGRSKRLLSSRGLHRPPSLFVVSRNGPGNSVKPLKLVVGRDKVDREPTASRRLVDEVLRPWRREAIARRCQLLLGRHGREVDLVGIRPGLPHGPPDRVPFTAAPPIHDDWLVAPQEAPPGEFGVPASRSVVI